MVNTTFTNLTDASRLIKADPDTSFPKSVKQAQAAQNKYEARLDKDDTKTATEKSRLKYKNALALILGLTKTLDGLVKTRREKNAEYKNWVTSWLDENSTTNTMIMNSTYQALKDWKPSELMKASPEDRNISKMNLTTPAGKYGYKLTESQRQQFFDDAVKHTLGDDLADYQSNAKILDALSITGENLLSSHNEIYSAMANIDARVVNGIEAG